jgi:prepilin-type N-terminal cleavage/methylation domain-containing protein
MEFLQPRRPCLSTQKGLTLLEVSVVLVVAGLMSWAAFSGYETVVSQQSLERGRAEAKSLQVAVRSFALRHGRLPCPDQAGTGYETLDTSPVPVCGPGAQVGWFPYTSIGLAVPVDGLRARYSVFRAAHVTPSSDADLAIAQERSGDTVGATTYQDASDLIVALNNAARLPIASSRSYLTGDGGPAGAINCTSNVHSAVAYWIVVPLQDRDGDGDRLDPPHSLTGLCAASPVAPLSHQSDDVVVAESVAQLAGWMRASLP